MLEGVDVPRWVRELLRLGVVNGIAVFLVWWLTTTLTGHIRDLDEHIHALDDRFQKHEAARAREEQLTNAFLYAICLNGSYDDTARARCAVALDGALASRP